MSAQDPLTTRFTDGGGRVLAVTEPLSHSTGYVCDKLNQLTLLTNAIGGLIVRAALVRPV